MRITQDFQRNYDEGFAFMKQAREEINYISQSPTTDSIRYMSNAPTQVKMALRLGQKNKTGDKQSQAT